VDGLIRRHLAHHGRFHLSLAAGIIAWFLIDPGQPQSRLLAAGDVFFGIYLLSTWVMWRHATSDDIRQRAEVGDEGALLIWLITGAAILICIGALMLLLVRKDGLPPLQIALSAASVPLGWLMLHTMMAMHYARLFYRPHEDNEGPAGGLAFPETPEPRLSDFFYYAFVVGMTAQVSDVQVLTSPMRLATLIHGIASFFFNTVIVALAVNIAVGFRR
jgi:uncharacterized membrane protein